MPRQYGLRVEHAGRGCSSVVYRSPLTAQYQDTRPAMKPHERRVYHINTVDDDRIYLSPSPECDHGDELVDIQAVADNNRVAVTSGYKLHCHAGCGNKTQSLPSQ